MKLADMAHELLAALKETVKIAREAIQLTGTDDEYIDNVMLAKPLDVIKRADAAEGAPRQ